MTCRTIGGGNWNYNPSTGAGQRGISGASGLNNIGMRVRLFGVVTQVSPGLWGPVWIDDGSASVQVTLPSGMYAPPVGTYLTVTGVVSCANSGGQINRLVLAELVKEVVSPPQAPDFVVGAPASTPYAGQVVLTASWPDIASSMKLYRSLDGTNWALTSTMVERQEFENGSYGVAHCDETTNAYYRFTGVNEGGESRPSEAIYARVTIPMEPAGVVVDYPQQGQTGVPQIPTFVWHANWSQPATVKWYDCQVQNASQERIWEVLTLTYPPATTLQYGQTAGVSIWTSWQGPLQANRSYTFRVNAVDTGNWTFARGSATFTTGP